MSAYSPSNNTSRVLVLGQSGQVASALLQLTSRSVQKQKFTFFGKESGTLLNQESLRIRLDEARPQVIINTAAYTAVDKAESERESAHFLNGQVPAVLGDWAKANGASVIHYSTDYVYPGTDTKPWTEVSQTRPPNWYGQTKLDGDLALENSGAHHIILRTSWVYSATGTNFVKTMLRLGSERDELKIVGDQVGSPTSAIDIAETTLAILNHSNFLNHSGVYHYCGAGYCSWYEFAQEIFKTAKTLGFPLKVTSLLPINTTQYPTPAMRPLNSRMSCTKILNDFNIKTKDWKTSLSLVLNELRNS